MEGLQKMMAQMQQGGQGSASGSGQGGIPAGMMNMLSGGQGGPDAMPSEIQLSPEEKRWVTVYPIYFDAKRRFESGCRRVPYTQSCLWPKSQIIEEAAARLTLMHAHEARKTHPRDWENPGRVKIQLFDADGKPVNQKLTSKKALLRAIAEIIQPRCGGHPPPLPEHPKKPTAKPSKANEPKSTAGKSSKGPVQQPNDNRQQPYKNANVRDKGLRNRVPIRVDAQERVKAAKRAAASQDRKAIQGGKLPLHSPMREAGILNTDLGGMMGPAMQGMGPLGAMMGSMGLGDDDEDDEDPEAAALAAQEEERKKKDPLRQLSRRQRKRVVRVGR